MARPRREDNKIYLHTHFNNGYIHAVSREPYEDKVTHKRKFKIVIWGKLDENNLFIPNIRFIHSFTDDERFVFPDSWNLLEVEKIKADNKPGRPSYDDNDTSRLYGSVWFLEQIADKIGLLDDLKKVFDNNKAKVEDLLTLAFYPLLSQRSYNHLATWQDIERLPSSNRKLTPPDITFITSEITEQNRMDFSSERMKRVSKDDVLAVDSTSKSTYGVELAEIRYGNNKEHLPLKQTNEVIVYSLKDHLPVFWKQLPGNIPDSRTVEEIYTELEHAGFYKIPLLTDRGYSCDHVLDFLIAKGNPFLTAVKTSYKVVKDTIAMVENGELKFSIDEESGLYYLQRPLPWHYSKSNGDICKKDSIMLNLYLDDVRKAYRKKDFAIVLQRECNELNKMITEASIIENQEELSSQFRYHILHFSSEGLLVSFEENSNKIKSYLSSLGYFASISYKLKGGAIDMHKLYKLRDDQEKYFLEMKNIALDDRNRASTEKTHSGRRFIMFLTLSVVSYIKSVWSKDEKLKKIAPTVLDVIDEMKCIRCVEHNKRAKYISPFVGKQLAICEAFDLQLPKGCEPSTAKRIDSVTGKKRRGRPSKSVQD